MTSRSPGRALALVALALCAPFSVHAQAAPDPEKPATVSEFVPPKVLKKVEPVYPEEAQKAGLGGTVLLQLTVGPDGAVREATVAKAAGHGFDEAALQAAKLFQFTPAMQGGTPIAVQVNYELTFALAPIPTLRQTVTADPAEPTVDPAYAMTVEADKPFTAASATTVRDKDLLMRPRTSPEDILRVVPGLVTAQHQGGGKADQLFLRGFDADHGTDVAVYLDGIPVNMPSHAHGQGYTDLHFLIPEIIERLEIQKGPYSADKGDFDTAGSVNLVTRNTVEHSEVSVQGGSFGTARVLGIAAPQLGSLHPWFAAELYRTDGPFNHSENLLRYNLFGKLAYDIAPKIQVSVLASAYSSSWVGSGQNPSRLIDSGFLDRFGAIDPTEGGDTQRQQMIVNFTARPDANSRFVATLSFVNYGLSLFNDFTFQKRDPANNDEIEQTDQRTTLAGDLRYERTARDLLPGTLVSSFGTQVRVDSIAAQLLHVRQRAQLPNCFAADNTNPCVSTQDRQTDAAGYLQEDWRPNRYFRLVGGLRMDVFEFDVHSNRLDGAIDAEHPQTLSPSVQAAILSPKLSAVVTPVEQLDVYLNFGSGFHSNDARSVIEAGGHGALPRALGGEVGVRTRLLEDRLNLAVVFWGLHLASEQVWSGDEGGTSPSDPTMRYGVDIEGRWSILPWLYADLDIAWAHSQYTTDAGNGNAVALAPPLIITAGMTARHPSGFGGSVRMRHISNRPGNQFAASDGVPLCSPAMDASTDAGQRCYLIAEGYTVFDAEVSYATKRWAIAVIAQNLTNTAYREAQFGTITQVVAPPDGRTVSRTTGQAWTPETHPVQDINYTPGLPFNVLVQGSVFF
jgi:TonB family protein